MSKRTSLADVSVLITKGTTPTSIGGQFTDSGINFVKSESVSDSKFLNKEIFGHIDKETDHKLKRSRLADGDLLFSIAGAYLGKIAIVRAEDLPANTNQAVGIVRLDKNLVDVNYVYYYFSQPQINKYINKLSSQSSQPNLNLDLLGKLEFDLRDLSTQQKIAAILSALDAKIELNQRINAELESMAKTLYDYWFVQFDFPTPPPPPAIAGTSPKSDMETLDNNKNILSDLGEAGMGYKSAGGKMVWNEKLNKKVPEGWQIKPLGKALKTNLGGTPSTKNPEYWENATIPWLNSGDLSNFPVISSSSFVTKKGVDNSATTILPKGSVVISLVRYVRPSIIALEACANQSVVGIRESEELKNTFIYPCLVNEVPRLMKLRTGAQQPHINKETIDETLLCIPPQSVLNKYYKISEPIYQKIISCTFETQTLTELRDWLLPMLMNGQVKVK